MIEKFHPIKKIAEKNRPVKKRCEKGDGKFKKGGIPRRVDKVKRGADFRFRTMVYAMDSCVKMMVRNVYKNQRRRNKHGGTLSNMEFFISYASPEEVNNMS